MNAILDRLPSVLTMFALATAVVAALYLGAGVLELVTIADGAEAVISEAGRKRP